MSKLFTNAEMEAIKQRRRGNKKDGTGIFSGRVKPKIIELLETWFSQKKELQKLIEVKHGKK